MKARRRDPITDFRRAVRSKAVISCTQNESLVHALTGEKRTVRWVMHARNTFTLFTAQKGGKSPKASDGHPGAIVYFPSPQRTTDRRATFATKHESNTNVFSYSPENAGQLGTTAFTHVVLLPQKRRIVLLVTGMERIFEETEEGKRDLYEKGLGATRHEALATAVLKIAREMERRGTKVVEVHAPTPETAAAPYTGFPEEQVEEIARPYRILESHFRGGKIQIHGCELKTINLSQPTTEEARRALAKLLGRS